MITTQKVTQVLRLAGFKPFKTESIKADGIRKNIRTGNYRAFKFQNKVGVETYGIKTAEILAALIAAGLDASETVNGSGMIKIENS